MARGPRGQSPRGWCDDSLFLAPSSQTMDRTLSDAIAMNRHWFTADLCTDISAAFREWRSQPYRSSQFIKPLRKAAENLPNRSQKSWATTASAERSSSKPVANGEYAGVQGDCRNRFAPVGACPGKPCVLPDSRAGGLLRTCDRTRTFTTAIR